MISSFLWRADRCSASSPAKGLDLGIGTSTQLASAGMVWTPLTITYLPNCSCLPRWSRIRPSQLHQSPRPKPRPRPMPRARAKMVMARARGRARMARAKRCRKLQVGLVAGGWAVGKIPGLSQVQCSRAQVWGGKMSKPGTDTATISNTQQHAFVFHILGNICSKS